MSLFFGGRERRIFDASRWAIPLNSQTSPLGGAAVLASGEASLQRVAVWASVALLAGVAGMLPVDAFTHGGAGKRERPLPGWMEDPAGDGYGLGDWNYQYVVSHLLRGNGYGMIVARGRTGLPEQIVLQHPDEVGVRRDPNSGLPEWRVCGQPVARSEMWHQRAYPVPGRIQGLSPIAHQALTLGLGLALLRFGNQFFTDGAHPTAMLKTTQNLKESQARTAKQRFLAAIAGREPVVLGGDWEFKAIQIAPEESQFIESNKMTSAECARIFGPGVPEILGYETGGTMTYSNIEQRNIQLLIYAIDPWLVRLERALTGCLPTGQYVKINRKALLRTDLLTRMQAYQLAIRNHIQAPSEVREIEDMPPLTPEQQAEFPAITSGPVHGAPPPNPHPAADPIAGGGGNG
jgi:HK97 family phage portal protein